MNTDDYYIQQIQRLEADRAFWQAAATRDERKLAELTAALQTAREELAIMNAYNKADAVPVTIYGVTLYADVTDSTVSAVYCEPGQNLEGILSAKDMDSIIGQVEDTIAEQAEDDDADDRFFQENNRD
jgi:hypothetical protein